MYAFAKIYACGRWRGSGVMGVGGVRVERRHGSEGVMVVVDVPIWRRVGAVGVELSWKRIVQMESR